MTTITEKDMEQGWKWYHQHFPPRNETRKKLEEQGVFAVPRFEGLSQKEKARYLFRQALNRGIISRRPCVVCGDEKSEGHHPDYYKPLEVVWLCKYHHSLVHAEACRRRGECGKGFENYLCKHPKSS